MIYPQPELVTLAVFAAAYLTLLVGVGLAGLRLAARPGTLAATPPLTLLFLLMASATLAVSWLLSLLAQLGGFRLPAIAALAGLLVVCTAWPAIAGLRRPDFRLGAAPAAGVILLILAALAFSLQTPGLGMDSTMYHLPLARNIVSSGALVLDPALRFPLVPQGQHVLMALGLSFSGEAGAIFLSTLPLSLILMGMAGICQNLDRPWTATVLAGTAFLLFPDLRATAGAVLVDLTVAMFGLAALASLTEFERAEHSKGRWLLLAGAMAGAVCATKHVGLPFALIVSLYLAVTLRKVQPVLLFVAAALVAGGLWYLRALLISGDPFHPFGAPYFGYFLWDRQDLINQALEQQDSIASSPLPGPLRMLWRGWTLVALACFVAGALVWRRHRCMRGLIAVALTYLLCWLLLSKVVRYLAPVLPALAIIVAAAVADLFPRMLVRFREFGERLAPIGAIAAVVAIAAFSLRVAHNSLKQWSDAQSRGRGMQAYILASRIQAERGGRVLQLGLENGKDFVRPAALGDHFGPYRYRQFVRCSTRGATLAPSCPLVPARQMRALMQRYGSSVLVLDEKLLTFDPREYGAQFQIIRPAHGQAVLIPWPS
jgi:hypothetical protein